MTISLTPLLVIPAPPEVISERKIIALDRLRLLSLAYYISGAIGAAMVSFLLIHFIVLIGISFIPASQWDQSSSKPALSQPTSPSPLGQASPTPNKSEVPPPIVFRLIAAAIGFNYCMRLDPRRADRLCRLLH